jgi:hypothetical protein
MTMLPGRGSRKRDRMSDKAIFATMLAFDEWIATIPGAQIRNESFYSTDWEAETRLGRLRITCYGDWLACRWEDTERAAVRLGSHNMNAFSGKWNHHIFARKTPAEALAFFVSILEPWINPASEHAATPCLAREALGS